MTIICARPNHLELAFNRVRQVKRIALGPRVLERLDAPRVGQVIKRSLRGAVTPNYARAHVLLAHEFYRGLKPVHHRS